MAQTYKDWREKAWLQAILERQQWIFAKTMPDNPHHYTLRKKWDDDEEFARAVFLIRTLGVAEWWPNPTEGYCYVGITLGGFYYWTMGHPIKKTVLINRKHVTCQTTNPTTRP